MLKDACLLPEDVSYDSVIKKLARYGYHYEVWFFDASEAVIMRFKK